MALNRAISVETDLHNEHKKTFSTKIRTMVSNITIEPAFFFYILPSTMIALAVQNLNLEKACRVNLNISVEHCDAITLRNESAYPDYKLDEERIQTLATYMSIMRNIIQSLIPGAILLFLGSWSDRFQKRKACIVVPILGDISSVLGLIVCTYFYYELPMEVSSLCEALFPAISGTWFAMCVGVYSFISDISSEDDRTVRLGAVNTLFNVSICIGAALSGVLYEAIGFYGVFSSAIAMYTIALTYCILRVRDPKTPTAAEVVKSKGFFRDFFQTNHIKETFKTAIKKGARGRRTRVCAIIFLYVVIVGPLYGELAVVYFYGRLRFGWDSIQYSMFTTFQFVTGTVGTVFSLSLFSQYLKLDDSILGMISCCTKVLSCLVYAFAPSNLYFYIGSLAELLNGTSFIAMRAMISKLVPPEELGKINSLFGVFEALVPMVYGPMYSRIYAMTINTFPGSFYIVGGALTMPAVFIFYWLYLQHKKDLVEEEKERLQHEKLLQYSKTG